MSNEKNNTPAPSVELEQFREIVKAGIDALNMSAFGNIHTAKALRCFKRLLALASAPPSAPVPPNAVTWHPIETAPKDNKRPLYLAQFNTETGDLIDLDWDASWEPESESWEIPQVYYIWRSANGRVEEPTHWAYQDLASAPQQPVGEPVCFIHPNDADMLKEQHKALRDIATYWKKPGNDAVPVYLGTPAQPGGSDNGSI